MYPVRRRHSRSFWSHRTSVLCRCPQPNAMSLAMCRLTYVGDFSSETDLFISDLIPHKNSEFSSVHHPLSDLEFFYEVYPKPHLSTYHMSSLIRDCWLETLSQYHSVRRIGTRHLCLFWRLYNFKSLLKRGLVPFKVKVMLGRKIFALYIFAALFFIFYIFCQLIPALLILPFYLVAVRISLWGLTRLN